MSEFMEVYTVTHMTYVCVFPCLVALFGIFLVAAGEVLSLNASNIFFNTFIALCILLLSAKAFKTMKEAPYFEDRMIQFQGIDNKLDK